jgi:hypothetical protein
MGKRLTCEDCTKPAYYNYENALTKRGIKCFEHKTPDMVNPERKGSLCTEKDCTTRATYKISGSKPTKCYNHHTTDMVKHELRKCKNCDKRPTYGLKNGKVEYCTKHKKEGMIDLKNFRCTKCGIIASYGISKREYCAVHKTDTMKLICTTICKICGKRAYYNVKDQRGELYCKEHKSETAVPMSNGCSHEGCTVNASFALDKQSSKYCNVHKTDKMISIDSKLCTLCNLPHTSKNKECQYCRPSKRARTKEEKIKKELETEDELRKFVYNKECTDNRTICGRYRPDFLYDRTTYFVILEVDEYEHHIYDTGCELIRMNNIAYGLGLPTIFIRFNPDTYKENGEIKKTSYKKRLEILKSALLETFAKEPTEYLTIKKLFYSS